MYKEYNEEIVPFTSTPSFVYFIPPSALNDLHTDVGINSVVNSSTKPSPHLRSRNRIVRESRVVDVNQYSGITSTIQLCSMFAISSTLARILTALTRDLEIDAVGIVLSAIFAVLILCGMKRNYLVAENEVTGYAAWDCYSPRIIICCQVIVSATEQLLQCGRRLPIS